MEPTIETRKIEKRARHDFGPTYRKIEKLADELVSKGTVSNRAQGVRRVIDDAVMALESDPQPGSVLAMASVMLAHFCFCSSVPAAFSDALPRPPVPCWRRTV